jgi:hypothetical protein
MTYIPPQFDDVEKRTIEKSCSGNNYLIVVSRAWN